MLNLPPVFQTLICCMCCQPTDFAVIMQLCGYNDIYVSASARKIMHSTVVQLRIACDIPVSCFHIRQPRTMQCNAKEFDQGGWALAAAVQACTSSSAIWVSSALEFARAALQA